MKSSESHEYNNQQRIHTLSSSVLLLHQILTGVGDQHLGRWLLSRHGDLLGHSQHLLHCLRRLEGHLWRAVGELAPVHNRHCQRAENEGGRLHVGSGGEPQSIGVRDEGCGPKQACCQHLLSAPGKCQIRPSGGEYGRDIAILGNPVAAYGDLVA